MLTEELCAAKGSAVRKFTVEKKYINWGITAFCVIAGSIIFYMLLHYVGSLKRGLDSLTGILSPFIWGLVIAYLLKPLMEFYERKCFSPLLRKCGVKKTSSLGIPKGARGLTVTMAEITMVAIIGLLVYLILPQVYNSIQTIVENTPVYVDKGINWADKVLQNYPQAEQFATDVFGNVGDSISNWFKNSVLPGIDKLLQNVTASVYNFLKGIYNAVIGIIVSIYILHNKEHFAARCKKILYSMFSVKTAAKLKADVDFTDKVFMGFITGKLLDSAIIGLMCYVFCVIARMPYALLVSVIVGVTNIIPFFGPFIGAVPSALLILLDSPAKCLVFVIFIIVLQQFDGNILGPKILGNSTGISGFWVMFSIILGAGLFGFWGMLLGVPVWVVIYTAFSNIVKRRLKSKNLPYDTDDYLDMDHIDPNTMNIIHKSQKDKNDKKEEPHNEAPPGK